MVRLKHFLIDTLLRSTAGVSTKVHISQPTGSNWIEVRRSAFLKSSASREADTSQERTVQLFLWEYEEAAARESQVSQPPPLERSEKVLEVEHLSTLTTVSNLASLLQDQGKYEEAEAMNRRVLEGREKVLGKEHLDTPTSVSNLTSDQGRYEAEAIRW
jgi:hypothetical protein